jgi:hypothetical protein
MSSALAAGRFSLLGSGRRVILSIDMESALPVNTRSEWTVGQKIAFRFFFVYLTLQVLTDSFLGNLVGYTIDIWGPYAKIFTPPFLWLNRHLFHFRYIAASWTTFSDSLRTIRDIAYLFLAAMTCAIWTLSDKKRADYNKLHYWFSQILLTGLSCILFAYGIIKVFPIQMQPPSVMTLRRPLGELSPFDLLWTTLGYGTPYEIFTGIIEVSGAILVLGKRTRLLGLFIILAALSNVIALNYTYQIGVLVTSFHIFLIAAFLLAPNGRLLAGIFLRGIAAIPRHDLYTPRKGGVTTMARIFMVLLVGFSFFANTRFAYRLYARRTAISQTRRSSLIVEHIVNSDTLKLIEKDTLRWRLWTESIIEGKRKVTIATMNPDVFKTYTLEQDSVGHMLTLRPISNKDSLPLIFTRSSNAENTWQLDGNIGHDHVRLNLQKIDPDAEFPLLRVQRRIIIANDEPE